MRYRINYRKDTNKMSETRSMVKSVLGFLLVIVVIIGGVFGFNVEVDIEDEKNPSAETVVDESTFIGPPETEAETSQMEDDEKDEVVKDTTTEDEKDTDSAVTTPVEKDETDVDNSADTEVAEPTEEETTATEGDKKDA
jgi:preprotein translocase subunit SecF